MRSIDDRRFCHFERSEKSFLVCREERSFTSLRFVQDDKEALVSYGHKDMHQRLFSLMHQHLSTFVR